MGGDTKPISLGWALVCMAASLVVAIAVNEAILPGKGKVVFLGVFVTSFVGKSIDGMASRNVILIFLAAVAFFHVLLVALGPNDNLYPGGLLFPIGVVDIGICYLAFRWTQKNLEPDH
ncbi:hypothetical protein [Sphingomonas sp. PB4P5]|uniref:hypothetical protein n=1 Tax=Parasphingomonas puruogangriensis TaxID=3096155 RepID=UPI002FCA3DF7